MILALPAIVFAEGDWPVLKSYEGDCLRRVKMPIGGIGTGTISLSGRGSLVDWEIRNSPAKGFTPCLTVAPGFMIRTEAENGKVSMRLLEGPIDKTEYEGGSGAPVPNHGFPRFRECRFDVAYPLAQVRLSDAAMPIVATLEATNPLIERDEDASGIPAALLRWKVENRTSEKLRVSICGFIVGVNGGKTERTLADGSMFLIMPRIFFVAEKPRA